MWSQVIAPLPRLGCSCPASAPYRLLRVRPTDTVLDGAGQPLPRGIWVAGWQPTAYPTSGLIAAYWDPATGLWRQQRLFDAASSQFCNGLAAFSATEAYLAGSGGRLWCPNGTTDGRVLLDGNIAGGYSRLRPTLAGGSDTGGFILWYDQQDVAHRGEAKFTLAPNNTSWQYVAVGSPPLANQYYSGGTDAMRYGGTALPALLNTGSAGTGSGAEALYRYPLSTLTSDGYGTNNSRLRLSGAAAGDAWLLDSSEDSAVTGLLVHNSGAGWTGGLVPPANAPDGRYCFWHGLWAGYATTAPYAASIWIAGGVYDFAARAGAAAVAHWTAATGWVLTILDTPYCVFAANGDGLQDIWVLADNDIWAVGSACRNNSTGTIASLVLHYDGTAWTERNIPA